MLPTYPPMVKAQTSIKNDRVYKIGQAKNNRCGRTLRGQRNNTKSERGAAAPGGIQG